MEDTFDFLIVGGGTAGCVLANRLSEESNHSVCLIEAGPADRNWLIHVPLGIIALKHHRTLNWRFESTAQPGAAGRSLYVPRGRTLGGSSSINGMVYIRGHPLDYDGWASRGNPGWSYADVLPYFLRSERNHSFAGDHHGMDGPLDVAHHEEYSPLVDMMETAARDMGWPVTADFNDSTAEGFGRRQVTVRRGQRASTATAFLEPARGRANLRVLTGTVVRRVIMVDGRAAGIEIERAGECSTLNARREVIVAAGTIASPTLLMRSGIGPAGELARHGIAVVRDLPAVGRNLQDHFVSSIHHASASTLTYGLSARTLFWWGRQVVRYAIARKGFLANNVVHSGGYVRSLAELDRPDLGFALMPAPPMATSRIPMGHGYGLMFYPLRPAARGSVTMSSADPRATPVIDFNVLSGPRGERDMAIFLRGLKLGRQLLALPAWDKVRGPEMTPGPAVTSDADLQDHIRRTLGTSFHPVGTCRMGNSADSAVVDPELKVHGIDGLRVVDASVMPAITSGNTMAPTIMIAEKAADLILGKSAPSSAQVPEFAS